MKKIIVAIVLVFAFTQADAQKKYEANWESLNTRKIPSWFNQDKFGIFIHWGVYSVPAFAPAWSNDGYSYAEWYRYRLFEKKKEFIDFHHKNYEAVLLMSNLNPCLKLKCLNLLNGQIYLKNQELNM